MFKAEEQALLFVTSYYASQEVPLGACYVVTNSHIDYSYPLKAREAGDKLAHVGKSHLNKE